MSEHDTCCPCSKGFKTLYEAQKARADSLAQSFQDANATKDRWLAEMKAERDRLAEKVKELESGEPWKLNIELAKRADAMAEKVAFLESPEALEAVAAECHNQWSGWTQYFFSRMAKDGARWLLEQVWVDRWTRQIETPYAELSEAEKDSDRREARKILAALGASTK